MRAPATLVLPLFLLLAPFADAGRVSLAPARAVAPLDPGASRRPIAMTTADLDGDRLTDLVVGFAEGGSGTIVVYRANRDALWPNGQGVRERWGAEIPPFLPAERAWVGERPDRLAAGDFDNDGKVDVVFAAAGSRGVWLLPGTRVGELGAPRRYDMPGQVTALASGEYGRADGLADLAVAVDAGDAAQLLVFEDPQGALRGAPEVHALPRSATEIFLADLDGDFDRDAIALAGPEIVVVRGRDRKLTSPEAQRSAVPRALVERHALGVDTRGFAIGRVIEPGRNGLVWLDDEGRGRLARGRDPSTIDARSLDRGADSVLTAALSGSEAQDVVLLEREARRLRVRLPDGSEETIGLPGRPSGAVALRLNADAIDDLVVLQEPPEAPVVALLSTPITVFLVTNTNVDGPGSLHQAVTDANAKPGIDAVHFNIPGTPPFAIGCPDGFGFLAGVTDTVTIDATTQPGYAGDPIVRLFRSAIECDTALRVTASSSAVYGLSIEGWGVFPAMEVAGTGNSVQGCTFSGNQGNSLVVSGTGFHEIGGVEPNSIFTSSCCDLAMSSGGSGTRIVGNRIGELFLTGADQEVLNNPVVGAVDNRSIRSRVQGNSFVGDSFSYDTIRISSGAADVLIGGTAVGAGNSVVGSAFGFPGLRIQEAKGAVVQGNSFSGFEFVPSGIELVGDTDALIGGIVPVARNVISGHSSSSGIVYTSPTPTAHAPLIVGNFIGTTDDGLDPLPNAGGIALRDAATGATIQWNRIAFNSQAGVTVEGGSGHTIVENEIFGNSGLGIEVLGAAGPDANDPLDADVGPNGIQNHPVLTSVSSAPGGTQLGGSLHSAASASYRVDFYGSDQADSSGFGEGASWRGTTSVTTNASGDATFSFLAPGTPGTPAAWWTATATAADGSTSEFSDAVVGTAGRPAEASPSGGMLANRVGTEVEVTYTPACEATDHAVVWGTGPITGALAWTGAACGFGVTGQLQVALPDLPPGVLVHFVVVGRTEFFEGSYGRSGAGVERPEAILATCELPQSLDPICP